MVRSVELQVNVQKIHTFAMVMSVDLVNIQKIIILELSIANHIFAKSVTNLFLWQHK